MTGLRVAICTASVGHGHTGAALAIAGAIRVLEPDAVVEVVDALTDAPRWFTRVYRDGYLATVAKLPRVAGWMYDAADRVEDVEGRSLMARAASGLEGAAMKGFVGNDVIGGADLVICTHFLCARVLSACKLAGELRAPLVVSVTDQHPHGAWLVPGAERILVASEEARVAALQAGVDAQRLGVTGVAVSQRFYELPSQVEARVTMGLPRDRGVILISCGGLGLCCMEAALESVLAHDSPVPVHVVAVCGRNELLRSRLDRVAARCGGGSRSCTVLGFTDQMHLLMAASDVSVGKPGGMTTAEAAVAGLPMVLLKPIPGQEDRNAQRLVRCGAAVLEPEPHRAMRIAMDIVTDRTRMERMRAGALAFSGSNAAGKRERGAMAAAECSLALLGNRRELALGVSA